MEQTTTANTNPQPPHTSDSTATLESLRRIEQYTLLAAKSILTVDEAIIFTGMSKSALYRLMSQREIPYSKPLGKRAYFDKADLEEWMMKNRVKSQDEIDAEAAAYIASHRAGRATRRSQKG